MRPRKTLAAAFLLLGLVPAFAQQVPPTLPDHTVLGRLGTGSGSGPWQAVPFSQLGGLLGNIKVSTIQGLTSNGPLISINGTNLIDTHNYAAAGALDLRYFDVLSDGTQALAAVINPGFSVNTAGSQIGDIDFLVYGNAYTVEACLSLTGTPGVAGLVPCSDNSYVLGWTTQRFADVETVVGHFSGGALATVSAGVGAVSGDATSGLLLQGYGSVTDVVLADHAGNLAASVVSNGSTPNLLIYNKFLLAGSANGTTALVASSAASGTLTLPAATGTLATTANINSALPSATSSQLYGGTGAAGTAADVSLGSHLSIATAALATDATSADTASTIVARDGSGNFAAGTITAANLIGGTAAGSALSLLSTSNGSPSGDTIGLQTYHVIIQNFSGGSLQPLADFVDNASDSGGGYALRFFALDSASASEEGAIINGGLSSNTHASWQGDIDIVAYNYAGTGLCVGFNAALAGVVPCTTNIYNLGSSSQIWATGYFENISVVKGLPFPLMGLSGTSATQFASSTTNYVTAGAASTSESLAYLVLPTAGVFSNLYAYTQQAPGSGQTYTVTFRNVESSTSLTCTISGTSVNTCSDTTHTVSAAAGSTWDIQFVTSSGAAATNLTFAVSLAPSNQ